MSVFQSVVQVVYRVAEQRLRVLRMGYRIAAVYSVAVYDVPCLPVVEDVLFLSWDSRVDQQESLVGVRRIAEVDRDFPGRTVQEFLREVRPVVSLQSHAV